MATNFKEWAKHNGLNMEREHGSWGHYKDPMTQLAEKAYEAGRDDPAPLYAHAAKVIQKHGLQKEVSDSIGEEIEPGIRLRKP
jgi:hypothetical protein